MLFYKRVIWVSAMVGGFVFVAPWCMQHALGADPSMRIQRPAYRVIDAHTHLHPDALDEAVRLMDRLGIRVMVNLSGGAPDGHLERQLAAARRYPGRFVVFTTPDFSVLFQKSGPKKLASMLKKAVALGARGLKIFKSLGLGIRDPSGKLLPIDSPLLDPLWQMAAQLRIPVSIHTGDPKAFFDPMTPQNERYTELKRNPHWSFSDRRRYPRWHVIYQQFLHVVARHRKTRFIGVHFGNNPEDVPAVSRALDRYPNLYVDIAARIPEIGRQPAKMVRAMFIRHQDRILFGTDLAIRIKPGAVLLPLSTLRIVETHRTPSAKPYSYIIGAPLLLPPSRSDVFTFYYRHWTYLQTYTRKMQHPTSIQGNWTVDGIGLPDMVLQKIYSQNASRLIFRK